MVFIRYLFLDGELDFDSLGVRLSPHKAGVDEVNFTQPLQPLQTDRQQLPRLQRTGHPVRRWLEVPGRRRMEGGREYERRQLKNPRSIYMQ